MSVFDGILLEESTRQQLEMYLKKVSGGLILQGDKGIGKSLCATRIASSILSCSDKELSVHPDFFLFVPDNGTVRMEQMQTLKVKSNLVASKASKKVFIIDDAELMSDSAQNAILKVLEDGNDTNIIIFITQQMLLPTIHSRSTTIIFNNPSVDSMRKYIEGNGKEVSSIALTMANGKLGLYNQILSDKELENDVKSIFNTLNTMKRKRELLDIFHILKEKDKQCFYDKYDNTIIFAFLKVLKDCFTDLISYRYGIKPRYDFIDYERLISEYTLEDNIKIAEILENHIFRINIKGAYNRNDFFDLVRSMVTN